ncbi:hypothetical protein K8W59_06150 [Nocardioides rotundus]|uniref:hypothetical protein n=1 Tax=Nocardioides rotundus TaxID=1774216 RepID=UPI001CBD827F|nr:hypothetical protein [Nocardioides rotundus]UAL31065.1 hypothetical protein K8W59_06150 [Nocardioides rotundus]
MRRREKAPRLGTGEKVLAWVDAEDGRTLAGTRDALHLLPEEQRIPWEQVQAAEWDRDTSTLTVSEVGEWGRPRPEHSFTLDAPGRLLELVRERVTASVVLQREAPVRGRRGVRVIARRAPAGDRALRWIYEYDDGLDPDDPAVRDTLRALLARAHEEVGGDLV